jgi:hypothetical protein
LTISFPPSISLTSQLSHILCAQSKTNAHQNEPRNVKHQNPPSTLHSLLLYTGGKSKRIPATFPI